MKVAKDLVVSLAYQVRTEDGVLVDESPVSAPLDYLHGHGSLISGLETALEGHEVGGQIDFQTVVQSVDAALHGIALYRLVTSLFTTRSHHQCNKEH